MEHYKTPEIKRRPDGSIDTSHYIKIGHQARADQACAMAKMAMPKRRIFSLQSWLFRASRNR